MMRQGEDGAMGMRAWGIRVGALLGLALSLGGMPTAAQAGQVLGVAGNFGEFVFENSTRSNTSIQGPAAVGGKATFSSVGMGTSKQIEKGSAGIVVGGALNASNGSLSNGNVLVGGTASLKSFTVSSGIVESGLGDKLPIDFVSEAARLTALSAAQFNESDAYVTGLYGKLTFAGKESVNYFNVTAKEFAAANSYVIDAPAGSTVVINVNGLATDFNNAGITLTGGITASGVLYNFFNATDVSISGISVLGSVLAPLANVRFDNGQLTGNLIARMLTGSGATSIDYKGGDARFAGELRGAAAVPEPSSLALMAAGALGGLVAFRRSRRRDAETN